MNAKLDKSESRVKQYIDGGNPYLQGRITEVAMCKEFVDDLYKLAKRYLKDKCGDGCARPPKG